MTLNCIMTSVMSFHPRWQLLEPATLNQIKLADNVCDRNVANDSFYWQCMIHYCRYALLSEFYKKTNPPHLLIMQLVQLCTAISAVTELLFICPPNNNQTAIDQA